jgi:uncharacterized protein (DUF1778 family)
MKKTIRQTRQVSPGISRSRRPKKGLSKQITFWVSEEEKEEIERAASSAGVSMSRFVMEKALKAARNVLREARSEHLRKT